MDSQPCPVPRRVGIVHKRSSAAAAACSAAAAQYFRSRDVEVLLDEEEVGRGADLVLVLGGDGTLIGMASRVANAAVDIPILGVNFGSLGFLTEITLPELFPVLESVLDGTARIEPRLMLHARTLRDGAVFSDRLALNDVVITRGAMSRIIDLSVAIGDQPVMRVRADGLIIASPTGSTAYNLAAGGPIVHPAVDALLLTPIAPHMLTNRPIVVPAAAEIRVQPASGASNDELFVTLDGQSGHDVHPDDTITIQRAERSVRLVRASARTYFDVLREKLKWSER